MELITKLLTALIIFSGATSNDGADADGGYLIYCPCMGRFGNQMEQFLGVLAFARALNRTLVLSPILEYPEGAREAQMHEFDEYFQLSPLLRYHHVVLLRDFMRDVAPKIWPPARRKVLCWSPRPGLANPSSMGCHATEGNPFGPFWRHAGVDKFVADEYFGDQTGGFDTDQKHVREKWVERFPVHTHPVLAFSSAPASFPAKAEHRPLQQFVRWNDQIRRTAMEFVDKEFGQNAIFVAIHLRNNVDWDNVCRLLRSDADDGHPPRTQLFASSQCTGVAGEFGQLTVEACAPSLDTILEEIRSHVLRLNASGVFVASDRRHHLDPIRAHLAHTVPWPVQVTRLEPRADLPVELALLGIADHLLANCVSTFSAFVVRQRHFASPADHDASGQRRSTSFLGFPGAAMELLLDRNEDDHNLKPIAQQRTTKRRRMRDEDDEL